MVFEPPHFARNDQARVFLLAKGLAIVLSAAHPAMHGVSGHPKL